MSTFPNAFGVALGPPMAAMNLSAINLPFGQFIKPGGRVAAYVRSTGAQDLDDLHVRDNLVASIDEGCKRCRSGAGDAVVVLNNHTESVAGADAWPNLVAGTQILSVGRAGATNNPRVTWTATAGQALVDVADVSIVGLDLDFTGITAVAAPVRVTGAGFTLAGCKLTVSATSLSPLECVTISTGAHDAAIVDNMAVGLAGVATNVFLVDAAVNNLLIARNHIEFESLGATDGAIEIEAVAALNFRIINNYVMNRRATAAVCLRFVDAAMSGVVANNYTATRAAVETGISRSADSANFIRQFENYHESLSTQNGILTPANA